MIKNTAGQKWRVYAEYLLTGVPYVGGASTITATLSKNGGAEVATNDVNPTEVSGGYYDFTLTQAETNCDSAKLITACSLGRIRVTAVPEVEYPDVLVSSRSNHTAAQVAALILADPTNLLVTDASGNVTITLTAAQIASILAGTTLTLQRGDTLTINLSGLGDISARTKLWFSVKESADDEDSEAQLFVEETLGLVYVVERAAVLANGETASITVTDAATGAITIVIAAAASKLLTLNTRGVWDVQMKSPAGTRTLTRGVATVTKDVTRAVA